MDILLASTNIKKTKELDKLLYPHHIYNPMDFGIKFECEENGKTFKENAIIKAKTLLEKTSNITNIPVLADDSGLIVSALHGELGVHTARFGSIDGKTLLSDSEKNKLLLNRLNGLKKKDRKAKFICVLVFIDRNLKIITASGVSRGYILEEPSGKEGFGYDPVFYNNLAHCSNAELGENKNLFSHRGKAAEKLLKKLRNYHFEKIKFL